MECDINSNGRNPGRAMMRENKKPPVCGRLAPKFKKKKKKKKKKKTERLAAISQVMTGHSG